MLGSQHGVDKILFTTSPVGGAGAGARQCAPPKREPAQRGGDTIGACSLAAAPDIYLRALPQVWWAGAELRRMIGGCCSVAHEEAEEHHL